MASCRFLASKQPQITSRCKQDWCYTLTGASRAWNWRGPTNSFVRWFSFWKWSLFGFHRKISSVSIPNSSTPTFHWKWNSIFGDSILTSYLFHTYIYIYPIFSGSNPNNVSIFLSRGKLQIRAKKLRRAFPSKWLELHQPNDSCSPAGQPVQLNLVECSG